MAERFRCPVCGLEFTLEKPYPREFKCPHCGATLQMRPLGISETAAGFLGGVLVGMLAGWIMTLMTLKGVKG